MPKCNFSKVAFLQLYWNHTWTWVLLYIYCIFSEYLFLRTPLEGCLWRRKTSMTLWSAAGDANKQKSQIKEGKQVSKSVGTGEQVVNK